MKANRIGFEGAAPAGSVSSGNRPLLGLFLLGVLTVTVCACVSGLWICLLGMEIASIAARA